MTGTMNDIIKCKDCLRILEFEVDGTRRIYEGHTPESCAAVAGQHMRTIIKQYAELRVDYKMLEQRTADIIRERGDARRLAGRLRAALSRIECVINSGDDAVAMIEKLNGVKR